MAGLAIVIPRTGPGTGPVLPSPVYTFGNGLDDYMLRMEASRAGEAGTVDVLESVVGPDLTQGDAGPAQLLDPGDGAFVRLPGDTSNNLAAADFAVDLAAGFSVAITFRRSGSVPNNFIRVTDGNQGYHFGVAGNGSWQGVGTSAHARGVISEDQWWTVVSSMPASPSGYQHWVAPTDSNPGAPDLGGPITVPNTTVLKPPSSAGTLDIASLVIWPRALTESDAKNWMGAVRDHNPLLY